MLNRVVTHPSNGTFRMIRPYALLLPFLFALTVSAQGPAQVFEFTCSEELPMSAEKYLTPEIRELDQQAQISIDGRTVKVRVAADVDRSAVAVALDGAGIGQFRSRVVTDAGPAPDSAGYPVMVHSEDPATDEAAYQAAKQRWITANPERYREMMVEGGDTFDTNMDQPE